MTGVEMIAKERKRQIEEEMYSANHDASNMGLALAGAYTPYHMNIGMLILPLLAYLIYGLGKMNIGNQHLKIE